MKPLLFTLLALLCSTAAKADMTMDSGGVCSAEYSAEQCEAAGYNGGTTITKSGGGSGSCTTPYMCTNSIPDSIPIQVWCRSTQTYEPCVNNACYYRACSGSNCRLTDDAWCCPDQSVPTNNPHTSDC